MRILTSLCISVVVVDCVTLRGSPDDVSVDQVPSAPLSTETIPVSPMISPVTAQLVQVAASPEAVVVASPETNTTEWSTKNIFGIIGIVLVVVLLLLSLLYSGSTGRTRTMVKVRVIRITLTESEEASNRKEEKTDGGDDVMNQDNPDTFNDGSDLPISAVVKMNSENPIHHIIPVQKVAPGESGPEGGAVFDIDSKDLNSTAFSVIVREGNIPVHFVTINGARLLKGYPLDSGVNAQEGSMDIEGVSECDSANLKGKSMTIFYEIKR